MRPIIHLPNNARDEIHAARSEEPPMFRMVRRRGEIGFQGAFSYADSSRTALAWQDIPIVDLTDDEPAQQEQSAEAASH